jgi:hypothetical protein
MALRVATAAEPHVFNANYKKLVAEGERISG